MSLSQSALAWMLLPYQWEVFGILAFHSYGLTSEERKIGGIVLNNFPYMSDIFTFKHAKSQWESRAAILVFFFVTRWVGVRNTSSFYRRQSPRALPCAANVFLLFFFFFFFKALVYRRHTNDHAETWWEQEERLWYRVPMATIQNGMHSPWQQSWRGNIAETASELVLASGCLKWCMHGSSTAFTHDRS